MKVKNLIHNLHRLCDEDSRHGNWRVLIHGPDKKLYEAEGIRIADNPADKDSGGEIILYSISEDIVCVLIEETEN